MTNSTPDRGLIYDREAAFFDYESIENRESLRFLYGGYGVALATDRLFEFVGEVQGKRVLEYGCGNGGQLAELITQGASAIGIELSQHSVSRTNQLLKRLFGSIGAVALPMNGEQLGFSDNSFDTILGKGILHHLDLKLALSDIHRALKPNGVGVFLEPRGDNILINLYRKLTPSQRTRDEHPLVERDFQLFRDHFGEVDVASFYFIAMFSFLVRRIWKNEAVFVALNKTLNSLDQKLIQIFPFLERFCWIAVIRVKKNGVVSNEY